MEKKRINRITKILELNHSIEKMYKRLYELEISGKMNTKEYLDIVDLIAWTSNKCTEYMLEDKLNDNYMRNFIELLGKYSNINTEEPDNFYVPMTEIPNRRFIEHNYELILLRHETDPERYEDDNDDLDEYEYDFDDEFDDGFEDELKVYMDDIIKEEDQLDDFLYAKTSLEIHTFMLYLLDTIYEEKDVTIKNKLIEEKYKLLACNRSIENTFLKDPNMSINLYFYQLGLHNTFKKDKTKYKMYVAGLKRTIDKEIMKLVERNKKEYKNIDEKVRDILACITLKTHVSIMPNEAEREEIHQDNEAGVELANTSIDKKVLKKSLNLNSNYIIYEK